MFDWLATRQGRLAAFFVLYITEGIPLGYTATFVATLMRREGVSPAAVGAFVATLYLPWSFKWMAGPVVDLFRSTRLGPRRAWIVSTQIGMTAAIAICGGLALTEVALFTAVVAAANVFGAVQDVAIDALAVDTLQQSERGLANGLMFAGAACGQAIGGSGALFLLKAIGFWGSTLFVVGCLLAVLLGVSLWLKERPVANAPSILSMRDVGPELRQYAGTALRAFFGSTRNLLGLLFAIMPAGGYALGLALQTTLAVELGLSDDAIATLNIASTFAFAVCCAGGGWVSDHFGRVRSLSTFIALTAVPTLLFGYLLWRAGWVMPIDPTLTNRPTAPAWLIISFWGATISFNMANGLMYGTRTAFFMDLSDPKVAATQFTAYMALLNLVISYTAYWQGIAIEAFGYPMTLVLDAGAGMVCLVVLAAVPFTPGRPVATAPETFSDERCPVCGAELSDDQDRCLACGEQLLVS